MYGKVGSMIFALEVGELMIEKVTGVRYSEIGEDFDEILEQVEAEYIVSGGEIY